MSTRLTVVVLLASLVVPCGIEARLPNLSREKTPGNFNALDLSTIVAEYDRHRRVLTPVEGGYQAASDSQQWLAKFDGRGFEIKPNEGEWTWGLEFTSYGFAGTDRILEGRASMSQDGDRVVYRWNSKIEEWFVNQPQGLEHGFTVTTRPPQPNGPLAFHLNVRGGLAVHVKGTSASFVDYNGTERITYSELKATDAQGRDLQARMLPELGGLRIEIDEDGATYPLRIDPISQQAYVKESPPMADHFGRGSVISGNTAVIKSDYTGIYILVRNGTTWTVQTVLSFSMGSRAALAISGDILIAGIQGDAAYVFMRNGTKWTQTPPLKPPSGDDSGFGAYTAISGNTAVVSGGSSAYVFVWDGTIWKQQGAALSGSGPVAISGNTVVVGADVYVWTGTGWSRQTHLNHNPSVSVAISGDTIVVGTGGEAAYVYERTNGTWSAPIRLFPPNASFVFAYSVAISGNTIVVGDSADSNNASGIDYDPHAPISPNFGLDTSGAAYVFGRSGGVWVQRAYIKEVNAADGNGFGGSVAVSGDSIIVGSGDQGSGQSGINPPNTFNRPFPVFGSGAAYIYAPSPDPLPLSQQAYVKPPSRLNAAEFGYSAAISGNTAVVGAPNLGMAYVYVWDGTSWKIQATLPVPGIPFQYSLAISGDTIIAGAPNSRKAYIFSRSGTNWIARPSLTSPSPNASDQFGQYVAISEDAIVVGAPNEGKSYVFASDGTNWTQQGSALSASYAALGISGRTVVVGGKVFKWDGFAWDSGTFLTPTNTDAIEGFGDSVAIDGDTIVVGAIYSDAAYVFIKNGNAWIQQRQLKASNANPGNFFGAAVSISGDTIIVGAPDENSAAKGVNNTPNTPATPTFGATNSGAAYRFVRNGDTWTEQTYLKASNTSADSFFGISVGVSGDMVIVGAPSENGGGIGVNPPDNPTPSPSFGSGAAYIFAPTSNPIITAAPPPTTPQFGTVVAGMHLAVGPNPLVISALGRLCITGNHLSHTIKLFSASATADIPGSSVSVNMLGCTPGQFVYVNLPGTLTLAPQTHYYLVSEEVQSGDGWLGLSPVTFGPSVSVIGGVYFNGTQWITTDPKGSYSYIVPSMQFQVAALPTSAAFILGYNLDNRAIRSNFDGFLGMRLQIGPSALSVSSIGRACAVGNSLVHTVKFRTGGVDVPGGSVAVDMAGCAPGEFVYSTLTIPLTLLRNTTYDLVSEEMQGGDNWIEQSQLATMPDAQVLVSVYALSSAPTGYATNEAYHSYVPPNFLYTK